MYPEFTTMTDVETVAKEELHMMHYPQEDVLKTEAERRHRAHEAQRAVTLGNAYHGKLDIYFQTADGATKRVQTTVWAADDEYLTLKSGVSIPMRAVSWMDFY
ncbi:hypothetical protein GCM10023185_07900 [Hymenobacter saemangeumensis]|uniref:Uncharacterized protein n=1 Tax=Hymenobacter saemangeumensis TaxID=1084522 RepID=A0ABP8I3J5_9BACT